MQGTNPEKIAQVTGSHNVRACGRSRATFANCQRGGGLAKELVVVVAQAFKETLSLEHVAAALEGAVARVGARALVIRGSDGGDGLLEAMGRQLEYTGSYEAEDPLGRVGVAQVGWINRQTAVIESRLVCGLSLLGAEERDPLSTTTRGVGTLVQRVAAEGARQVLVGLGGSATMDGGVGMARAWGWVPRDAQGSELPEGGGALTEVARFDVGQRPAVQLIGLCDVQNPLNGPKGARVFAAQKGASPHDVERLAAGLEQLTRVLAPYSPEDVASQPGAGAAGGLGFGLTVFGQGRLQAGAQWVLEQAGFDEALAHAALVVTGEGAFDHTSLHGKLTGEVLRRAERSGVPAVLLAPRASDVPSGIHLESGGGMWSAASLECRAHAAITRALRLLGK